MKRAHIAKPNTTPATHQPTQADMDEVIAIDATPDQIAAAVLKGGAKRREPESDPGNLDRVRRQHSDA